MHHFLLVVFTFFAPALTQFAVPSGIRPDVSFAENNRFDVSNIINHVQKHSDRNILDVQSEEFRRRGSKKRRNKKKYTISAKNSQVQSEKEMADDDRKTEDKNSWLDVLNTRKGSKHIKKKIIKQLEDRVNQLANTLITKLRSLRRSEDFAYHDAMDSNGEDDFDESLRKFKEDSKQSRRLTYLVDKLHGGKKTRRNMVKPETEILLHYGFPVHMKIEGFLQKP